MKLFNTLTGEEELFQPYDGKTVKMYVCGVTPYSSTHVGHALSYVVFDTLRRYLEYLGYDVKHVQNFTDVDDKIIQRANEEGITGDQLTDRFIGDFFATMDRLNVQRADSYPRATQEIPGIISTITTLIDKEFAYPANGDVYFRVTKSNDYGKLSHRTLDGMIAGARIQVDENKEHPMDFVLWKAAKPGEPSWDSPWGAGRPGWHIECTAMALDQLGDPLDIHGGGHDLVFPHHENEIAQSEAFTGRVPFTRHWVHNGLLQFREDKMSKSLGNLVSAEEALENYTPDALRIYFLDSHYRSPLSYSSEGAAARERSMDRLRQALKTVSATGEELDPRPFKDRFLLAMDDDLNTPQAIACLFDLAREINRACESGKNAEPAQNTLKHLGSILGLTFEDKTVNSNDIAAKPFIDLLVSTRQQLRDAKQYSLADMIRDELANHGVTIEDQPQGSEWQYEAKSNPT